MAKKFNITGTCYPEKHYMVDISERLSQIESLVEDGEYITINRGRQYGKTTTLYHLAKRLSDNYLVFSISFEVLTKNHFKSEEALAYSFLERFQMTFMFSDPNNLNDSVKNTITEKITAHSDKKKIAVEDLTYSYQYFVQNPQNLSF